MTEKKPLTLGEFREKTKQLPDNTQFLLDIGHDSIDIFDMELAYIDVSFSDNSSEKKDFIIIKEPGYL